MKKNGFTFIEIILYIAIISIVISALIPFAWNIIRSGVKSGIQQKVSGNILILSERIKSEIRNANGFNASDFGVNLAADSAKKLSLMADAPNDPTIIDVSGGQIRIKQGSGSPTSLNPSDINVTNLVFTNYSSSDNKSKHIGFTLTISTGYSGSRQEYNQSASVESSAEIRSNSL